MKQQPPRPFGHPSGGGELKLPRAQRFVESHQPPSGGGELKPPRVQRLVESHQPSGGEKQTIKLNVPVQV